VSTYKLVYEFESTLTGKDRIRNDGCCKMARDGAFLYDFDRHLFKLEEVKEKKCKSSQ